MDTIDLTVDSGSDEDINTKDSKAGLLSHELYENIYSSSDEWSDHSDEKNISQTDIWKSRPLDYYQDNMTMPYFWKGQKAWTLEEVLMITTLNVDKQRVCSSVPYMVMEDACFVIDTKYLQHSMDYTSDGIGNFRNSGHSGRVFTVTDNKVVSSKPLARTEKDRQPLLKNQYLVKTVYWSHQKHKEFKKKTYEITSGLKEHDSHLVFVSYSFSGEPAHPVTPTKKVKLSESTKHKIKNQVQTSQTPSTIYDNLFSEAGGLNFSNISDLPRNLDQIKYERRKIRKKGDFDEFATLLKLSNDTDYVKNLQWTPHPRCVVLTDAEVQDVVDNCAQAGNSQAFTVDTTFNVGPFYVTTSTYKHLKLIDRRSGKHPNLPGPALFHTRQDTGQFTYMAQTLAENNRGIGNILALGSDLCTTYCTGFAPVCPLARVVVCKKHAEDAVKRKLDELGITGQDQEQCLTDVFGNERKKVLGLIDSESPEDFDDKLLVLMDKWIDLFPLFADYFRSSLAKEMKTKMILSVRREVGLGDEFFYDNATESINHRYKVCIREGKPIYDLSGSKHLNCTMAEACNAYKRMLDETRRNIHRAILGMGPYKLAPPYENLAIQSFKWQELSDVQKVARLRRIDKKVQIGDLTTAASATPNVNPSRASLRTIPNNSMPTATLTTVTASVPNNSMPRASLTTVTPSVSNNSMPTASLPTVTPSVSNNSMPTASLPTETSSTNREEIVFLCDFELTYLPEVVKGSWYNAEKILKKNGVGAAPGDGTSRVVASNSGDGFHRVKVDKQFCPRNCDCEGYKELGICAHCIAVSFKEKTLDKIISSYQTHLPSLVTPKPSAGNKPGEKKRKKATSAPRDVRTYSDPLKTSNIRPSKPEHFCVVFVKNTRMQKCYGCKGTVRASLSVKPPSPWDIVLTRKEFRVYNKQGSTVMHISAKRENVYYHPRRSCIEKRNDDVLDANSIKIPDDTNDALDERHKALLRMEFGLSFS